MMRTPIGTITFVAAVLATAKTMSAITNAAEAGRGDLPSLGASEAAWIKQQEAV